MNESSRLMMQLSKSGGPGCVQSGPIPVTSGGTATLVIASASGACRDKEHEHTGIVFHDSEPVAWSCMSDEAVAEFTTWVTTTIPAVQVVTVSSPLPKINCPPPSIASPLQHAAIIEAIRSELRSLAPHWFTPASATEAAKQVA